MRVALPQAREPARGRSCTHDRVGARRRELGEAANIAKKLNRTRDGIPGNKASKEELAVKLRQELGDTFVYLDLLAQACGISIGDAAVEVFNVKSQELKCSIMMLASEASKPVREMSPWEYMNRGAA